MKQDGFRVRSGLAGSVFVDETVEELADQIDGNIPSLPSSRVAGVMFSLSREKLRTPINEGDSLTYGDVFYANKLVRVAADNVEVVTHLIRSEHQSAADLLAWCRNDVAIAISIAEAVCRLRMAIVMSDNS